MYNEIKKGGKALKKFNNLKYKYIVTNEFDIDTSFVEDFSQITNEIIEQTDSQIISYSKYPNNFEILFIQKSDQIEIRTNLPLYFQDGKYHVKFD